MIVADGEADLASGKLSVNSPIGKGLLGKSSRKGIPLFIRKRK